MPARSAPRPALRGVTVGTERAGKGKIKRPEESQAQAVAESQAQYQGNNINVEPSSGLYTNITKNISTPQGVLTINFSTVGGSIIPVGISKNVVFTQSLNSTQGNLTLTGSQTFTYAISGGKIIATQKGENGIISYLGTPIAKVGNAGAINIIPGSTVTEPQYAIVSGNKQFLGGVIETPSYSNGTFSLIPTGFAPSTVTITGSFSVANGKGGQNVIGYSFPGITSFNLTNDVITITPEGLHGPGTSPLNIGPLYLQAQTASGLGISSSFNVLINSSINANGQLVFGSALSESITNTNAVTTLPNVAPSATFSFLSQGLPYSQGPLSHAPVAGFNTPELNFSTPYAVVSYYYTFGAGRATSAVESTSQIATNFTSNYISKLSTTLGLPTAASFSASVGKNPVVGSAAVQLFNFEQAVGYNVVATPLSIYFQGRAFTATNPNATISQKGSAIVKYGLSSLISLTPPAIIFNTVQSVREQGILKTSEQFTASLIVFGGLGKITAGAGTFVNYQIKGFPVQNIEITNIERESIVEPFQKGYAIGTAEATIRTPISTLDILESAGAKEVTFLPQGKEALAAGFLSKATTGYQLSKGIAGTDLNYAINRDFAVQTRPGYNLNLIYGEILGELAPAAEPKFFLNTDITYEGPKAGQKVIFTSKQNTQLAYVPQEVPSVAGGQTLVNDYTAALGIKPSEAGAFYEKYNEEEGTTLGRHGYESPLLKSLSLGFLEDYTPPLKILGFKEEIQFNTPAIESSAKETGRSFQTEFASVARHEVIHSYLDTFKLNLENVKPFGYLKEGGHYEASQLKEESFVRLANLNVELRPTSPLYFNEESGNLYQPTAYLPKVFKGQEVSFSYRGTATGHTEFATPVTIEFQGVQPGLAAGKEGLVGAESRISGIATITKTSPLRAFLSKRAGIGLPTQKVEVYAITPASKTFGLGRVTETDVFSKKSVSVPLKQTGSYNFIQEEKGAFGTQEVVIESEGKLGINQGNAPYVLIKGRISEGVSIINTKEVLTSPSGVFRQGRGEASATSSYLEGGGGGGAKQVTAYARVVELKTEYGFATKTIFTEEVATPTFATKFVPVIKTIPVIRYVPFLNIIPVTRNISITKTVPTSKVVPTTKISPISKILPVTKIIPTTKTVPVTKNVPVTKVVPVFQIIPITKVVPITKNVPITKTIPVTKTVPVTKIVPITKTVPIIQTVPITTTTTIFPPIISLGRAGRPAKRKEQGRSVINLTFKYVPDITHITYRSYERNKGKKIKLGKIAYSRPL